MLAGMTSEQFSEWQVFATHFHALPDGPREAALITSTMVNLRSKSKTTVDDFIPVTPLPKPPQSAEVGIRKLRAIAAARSNL